MKKLFSILFILIFLIGCQQNNINGKNNNSTNIDTTKTIKINQNQDLFSQLTYLSKIYQDFENTEPPVCQQISTIIESGKYSYEKELLNNDQIKSKINSILKSDVKTEKFFKNLKSLMANKKITLVDKLCIKNDKIYITLPENDTDNSTIYIVKWLNDKEDFKFLKGIKGTIDLAYTFIPEFSNEEHLVKTGYGDAGNIWWQFNLLNEEKQNYEEVENCQGNYLSDEEFQYTCKKEFKP